MACYRFGDCELDTATRTLQRGGQGVRVEPKVLDLLIYLIERRDRFLTHAVLLDALWPEVAVAPAALARAIKEARRCVGDDGRQQTMIATLHARGYRFVAEVREAPGRPRPASAPHADTAVSAHTQHPSNDSTHPALGSELHARAEGPPGIMWLYPRFARVKPFPAQGALLYGRGEGSDVTLSGRDASRRHAEVRADGPLHVLQDLGSVNGSFVNGARVTQAPLQLGDVVRMGDALGLVTNRDAGALEPRELHPGCVGGRALAHVRERLRRAAADTMPVVVIGETGSGKSLVASVLHALDPRGGALRVLGCTALAAQLAAQLPAAFEETAGGTLVLHGLAELPPALQAHLLALLEESTGPARRIVVTASEPLERAVARGQLRADLHARLAGLEVLVPPLRERIEDVPALFAHFMRTFSGGAPPAVSASLIERLCLHDWPYNVRELELLTRRLLLLHAHEPPLRTAHLPDGMQLEEQGQ
jgi:DNA-binding winged helix-turn-helix (wHTH) protein